MRALVGDIALRPERRRLIPWLLQDGGLPLAAIVSGLFALNFNSYIVHGDGAVPLGYTRFLLGQASNPPVAYQFGLAYLDIPFYAIGHGLETLGLSQIFGHPTYEVVVAFSGSLYVYAAAAVMVHVLRQLGFRSIGFTLFAAVFGTSVFFYGVWSPAQTHAAETLLFALIAVFLLRLYRDERPSQAAAVAGVLFGLTVAVRYFDVWSAMALALVLVLQRRIREASVFSAVGAATFGVLILIPLATGTPLFARQYRVGNLGWTPHSLPDSLFSDQRGLFVWTPLTLLSIAGFVRLMRKRTADRPFLTAWAAMAAALCLSLVFVPFWTGGESFSQRYLTCLFPFYAIGLAAFLNWRPKLAHYAASAAVVWTLFLGCSVWIGWYGGPYAFNEYHTTATDLVTRVTSGRLTPFQFFGRLYYRWAPVNHLHLQNDPP